MSVAKYLQNCQSGFYNKRSSSRNSIGEVINVDILLPNLKSHVDDVFIVRNEVEEEVPPTAVRFCPRSGRQHLVAVANEDGGVALFNTRVSAGRSLLTKWTAHTNAIFDVCWSDSNLLTASGDKTVQLWDTTVQTHICTMRGHTSSVKTIDLQTYSQNVFATGSRDGNIMVWDVRSRTTGDHHTPVLVIQNGHDAHASSGTPRHRRRVPLPEKTCVVSAMNSIASIVYQSENLLLSVGASDSEIKLWDLRASKKDSILRKGISHHCDTVKPKGYSCLALHPSQPTFFANGVNGVIYQYNCSSFDLVATYYGHTVKTHFVKIALSADGKYMIGGSSSENAYIWKVSKPGPPVVHLSGHLDEVTSVAFCPTDPTKVVTCSDDARVMFWNVHLERRNAATFVGEAEEIDREATKSPPGVIGLLCGKPIDAKTPRSKSSTFSPVLTRWLTPKSTVQASNPINVTPVKRTFTLPKKRKLSNEDEENSPSTSKRVPCSPNSKAILTQRQYATVARRLNPSFTLKEHEKQVDTTKRSELRSKKCRKSSPSNKKDKQVLNSIKNYFQVLYRT